MATTTKTFNTASGGQAVQLTEEQQQKLAESEAPIAEKLTEVERPSSFISTAADFNVGAIPGAELERSAGLPEPTAFIETQVGPTLSDKVSQVAGTTFTSNQLEIDNLRAELGRINEAEKVRAQEEVERQKEGIQELVGTTAAQDALAASDKKFQVEENIALYADVQTKVVAAQEALEMGLIYEKDRPARMKFITGAESTLMKQGLATIGALQGTAAVIKGNLDLARSFGDATMAAINQDNQTSFKALTTLLDLAQSNLIDLEDRERTLIDDRITAIEDETTRLEENKEKVLDLMTDYPKAFLAGGVTLLDSREEALRKMLPTMAADERALFEASLSAGVKDTTDAEAVVFKQQLLGAKNNGMPYEEAVLAFGDVLSVGYINDVYERGPTIDPQEQVTGQYYSQFLDPMGGIKEGYSVSIDKGGRPVVTKTEEDGPGFWSGVGGAFKSLFD